MRSSHPTGEFTAAPNSRWCPVTATATSLTSRTLDAVSLRPAGEFDDWYDAMAAGETGCRECAILPLCGGACPKLWREGSPPCPPLRDNVRQRLDLFALTAGYTPVPPSHLPISSA